MRASTVVMGLAVLPVLACGIDDIFVSRGAGNTNGEPRPGQDADASGVALDGAASWPDGSGGASGDGGDGGPGSGLPDAEPPDAGPLVDRTFQVAPDTALLHQTNMNRELLKPVWNGSRWVLFWERMDQTCTNPPGPGNIPCVITSRKLMATVLTLAGDVESVHVVETLDAYANEYRDLDAIATPGGYLVTWVQPTGPELTAQTTIHVAAIDSSFHEVHKESFGALGGWWVKLAGGGTTYALFWQEHTPHQQDYFVPLSAGGVRGTRVPVSMSVPRLGHHLLTDMAWDGSRFGLLYESDAERIVRCGCSWSGPGHPVEEFLMLLTPSGSRTGTIRLSEGIEEGMEIYTAPSLAARPGGGFVATWVTTVGGGPDVVLAQVDPSGNKIGANVRLTNDNATNTEVTPRVSSAPGGYFVSYGYADATQWTYGARVLELNASGAQVSARSLVPPPPACAALESAAFAGARCYNGSRSGRRFYQAAVGRHVVTAWPAEIWTTLPGDTSGDWIIDHVGLAAFTHW